MLLFQTLASSFALPAQINAAGSKNDFIRNITLLDEAGNVFNEEKQSESTKVNVVVDWSVTDTNAGDGSSETVGLSSSLNIQEGQMGKLVNEDVEVGTYTATVDGALTVIFNEAIAEYPQASGTFEVVAVSLVEATEDPVVISEEEAVEEETSVEEVVVSDEEIIKEETSTEEEVVSEEEVVKKNAETETFNVDTQKELGNIFTFDYLKIDGEDIHDGDIIVINEGTLAQLGFKWDTEGLNAKAGDTSEVYLSDAFEMVTTPAMDIIVDGIVVGTFNVENGVLRFVFNENIENDDVQNGFVNLGLEFNLEKFRENIEQQIPFNDDKENNITVIARPNAELSGIEKEGHPDTQHDAREITWTIDVINTNDEEITDAFLADNIPNGLGEARNFIIHKLSVGYDGDKRVGEDVTSTLNPSEFPINLGTIAPFNGYRVQYTTTIENYAAESFTNDATFEYGDTSLPADATVGGLTRSNPIEKSGWQIGSTDEIQWQIDLNKNGSLISEAIIEDSLPDGLTVDPDSIQVVKITQDGGNWVEGDAHEDLFTAFPINLGTLGQEDAYRIKFKTNVDWSKVNDGEYQQNNGFLNEATLFDGEDELNNDDATVSIVRDPILRKAGVSNVDYENKTVTWTIYINEAGHPIGNVVLTDLIPEGLSITESDIVITDEEGNSYNSVNIDLNSEAEDGTEVIIDLGDVGTRQLKVEYITEITDFTINQFNNGVGMTGDGIGENGENSNAEIKPAGNTYNKGFAGIDYNEKTIDWQLTVNPRREPISSLTIEDTFPNKGMILLPNTVEVKFAGETLEKDIDYTLTPRTEEGEIGYHKGFTITLLENALPLNGGQLVVDYQTSYDPQKVVEGDTLDPHISRVGEENQDGARLYVNRAHFEGETINGNPIDVTRSADTEVRLDSWNSGKKEGQLVHFDDDGNAVNGWVSGSERKIAWQLYTNYQEQNLGTGVSITDELAYAGVIDADSIKVSVYDVATDGETTITDTVIAPDNYSVTLEGNKFTLTFAEGFEVTERYVIEFTTSVPDLSKETYTNNAKVIVGDVEYPYSATLNYSEYDDFLEKSATGVDRGRVFTGDEVDWEVAVNESLSIIKNAVIKDTISAGHVYLEDSLEVVRLSGTEEIALVDGTDYELNVTTEDGEGILTITLSEDLADTLVLRYTTVVTATDGTIGNKISIEGSALEPQVVESNRLEARQFADVGGEWAPNRGALRVTKVDSEEDEVIANNEATFTLWYDLNGERVEYTQVDGNDDVISFTTENGILEIGNLPLRTYYLVEKESPIGYVLSEKEIEIKVDKAYRNSDENIVEVEFENIKEKIDVTGTKVWDGGPKPAIQLQLFKNGEAYGDPVTLEDETEYTWTDLDRTDINGKEHEYTVDEVNVPENYDKAISEGGLTITNKFVSPLIDISVKKVWEDADNQDGIRPGTIEVTLFANGDETDVENVILNSENNWQGTFTGLPEFDNNGEQITYTIEEVDVPDQYESDIDGDTDDGYVITNRYIPKLIDIPVEKVWEDGNNQDGNRPNSITVRLLADGEPAGHSIDLNASNNWKAVFTNLDEYKNGNPVEYTIEEVDVPEKYESIIEGSVEDGYTITNSYTPEVVNIPVEKIWDDADDQDGVRPDKITIQIYDDISQLVATKEVTSDEEGNWSHVFENLPKYRDGIEIEYRVAELTVDGYSAFISEKMDGIINVTNERTPDQTSVTVNKFWDDENDQDGLRPDYIKVQLLADGEPLGEEVFVTAENNWSYTWSGLDANRDGGKPIEYTVVEVEVPEGYAEPEINSEDHGNIILTNHHTPEVTTISGEKIWDDANNQDGIRPDSITVNLFANGEKVNSVVVTEESNWQYSFEDLPKYANGEKITYTVEEVEVDGYETEIDGFNIINKHTPGVTSVSGEKAWKDGNNEDGARPESIIINLLADGKEIDSITVSSQTDWQYIFENLPTHRDGKEITYTVEEEPVEGYETTIKDFDITNLRVGTTEVEVTKLWKDDSQADRPDKITINLLQNGAFYDQYEVTAENDWELTITDLPQFDEEGKAYKYTISEHDVPGYTSEIDGFVITNTRTDMKSIEINKSWLDDESEDRPDSIEVELFRFVTDGDLELVDTYTITADEGWSLEITDLPVFDKDGKAYTYEIKEKAVEGYKTIVNGFDITNLRVGETEVLGTKTWLDDNSEGRPDSITVILLQNGEQYAALEVTEADNWSYEFNNLPAYDENGIAYVYNVEEEPVEGYETIIDGYNITNIRTGTTSVEGTKTWKDDNASDRPEMIKVNLLQNGVVIETKEVTKSDDWKYSFTDLPEFDEEGVAYVYTVAEHGVPGYDSEVNGYDITNTRSDLTSVKVTKGWDDNNSESRPDSITVHLLQNGEVIETVQVTATDNWVYEFTDLPAYDKDGVAYIYTIEEDEVDGYVTTIDGYNITNTSTVEDPEDPEDPKDNTEKPVDKDDNDKDSVTVGGKKDKTDGNKLPKTATNMFNILVVGIGLLGLGSVLVIYRRKKETH